MNELTVLAYAISVLILCAKLVATVLIQGRGRLRTKRFRYAEDAAHWRGEAVDREEEIIERAQAVLRNDSESQPLFLALGAVMVATPEPIIAAPIYFLTYAVSRVGHARYLISGRQPHRNYMYSIGLFILLAMAVNLTVVAVVRFTGTF